MANSIPTKPAQARILEAAVTAFAASGYAGTSLRAIASKADCDVALIPYYFGSKEKLFRECTGVVAREAMEIPSVAQVGPENAAHDLTASMVERFYDDRAANMVALVIRSAAASETTPPGVRDYVEHLLQRFFDVAVGISENREDRLPNYLFGASLMGAMIMARMVCVPAFVEMTHAELVDLLAPELQVVIDRDLREGFITLPE